jgi:hypothetical protein
VATPLRLSGAAARRIRRSVYPPDQVARLKLIKQLLSEGWRAGAVVPLAESALQSMLGLAVDAPAPIPDDINEAVGLLAEHRIGELQNQLSKLLIGYGLRNFLERTLIPLNEAVHDRVCVAKCRASRNCALPMLRCACCAM